MHPRLLPLALGASLIPPGCAPAGDVDTRLELGEAHLRADFACRLRKTGHLIGWNLGRGTLYARPADPIHPEWRTAARVEAVARLHAVRTPTSAPWMRFSGLQIDGALGQDGYHFWRYVRPDRETTPADNMAPFQYLALMAEAGAAPLVTINFGSGTAEEAGRYVRYLNDDNPQDPLVAAREHWEPAGRPLGQSVFEVGNEVYGFWNTGYQAAGPYSYANPAAPGGGDPAWAGRPSSDPHDFAARARQYAATVRQVTPEARVWVPLTQASMDSWGGLEVALPALQPLLSEPAVAAVVVHHYQLDDLRTLGLADRTRPEAVLGGFERFRREYQELRQLLEQIPRPAGDPLQLAVTEFHVAGAFSRGQFAHGEAPLVGLGLAELLIGFAQVGVDHACQHLSLDFDTGPDRDVLVEPWYNPFRLKDGRVQEMPAYRVPRLWAEHVRRDTVELITVISPTGPLAVGEEEITYPLVHAVAFADEDEGTVVMLNRGLERDLQVTLDVPHGAQVIGARRYAPAHWDGDALQDDPKVEEAAFLQDGQRIQVVLPRHSLLALRARLQ